MNLKDYYIHEKGVSEEEQITLPVGYVDFLHQLLGAQYTRDTLADMANEKVETPASD
jgi:hypothetical protein